MKLSIITINRNNLEGLKKTMESVFLQTFKDFEYIVIDGASTDGSADYIKNYAERLTYWVSEPDSGIYNAMNKGILASHGEYLMFLNSGDFLVDDNVVESIIPELDGTDIVCARCNVSKNNKVVWCSTPPNVITLGTLYYQGIAHQSTFIKGKIFEKYGLYREDFKYNSDIEFWYRSIIFGNATTKNTHIITTDYNLNGISSKEYNSSIYKKEKNEILDHPFLRSCLPDYDGWREEKKMIQEYSWINNHQFLRFILRIDYKIRKHLGLL